MREKYRENIKSLNEVIPYVTVKGSLVPTTAEDRMRLVYLLRKFAEASRIATLMLWRGERGKKLRKESIE